VARKYRADGKNPYIKQEGEAKFNYDLIMDEARQKWRAGSWRADSEDFHIDKESFAPEEEEKGERPSSDRFALDVKNDLLGDSISLSALEKLNYSPSYRPSGKLSERIAEPMSTPRRYDVLAGMKEAPPEDISFLSDASVRRARLGDRKGALRKDTRRLGTSVDERRSAILRMIPEGAVDDTSKIISESKKRKARLDKEMGKAPEEKEYRKRFQDNDPLVEAAFKQYMERGTDRLERLPKQSGIMESSQSLPEFERQTRRWSDLTVLDPSAAEVMRITENYNPEQEEEDLSRAHFISDVEYDPNRPFRKVRGVAPRERIRARLDGSFESVDNEYVREAGVDPERIRQIMNHRYRGRWVPPDFFNDDELVYEYFNQRNRGNLMGEDFVAWAQRQRAMVEQLEYEESMRTRAKYERRRGPAPGRRAGMPRRAPMYIGANYNEMYEEARMLGRSQGSRLREEEEEERRREVERKKAAGVYAGQYPDLFSDDGKRKGGSSDAQDKRYAAYRRQYEQYQKQMEQYQRQLGEQYRKMQQQNGQSRNFRQRGNTDKRQG